LNVGKSPSPDIRIGDIEREEALQALGEHMRVGRLDVDEYGERAAHVTAAKTRGELTALFADLPEPHRVRMPGSGAPPKSQALNGTGGDRRSVAQRIVTALVPLSTLLAIVLFFSVSGMNWLIFLLPCAVAVITGALWGEEKKHRTR
jgi:Domain of unknown function (DUF1707)